MRGSEWDAPFHTHDCKPRGRDGRKWSPAANERRKGEQPHWTCACLGPPCPRPWCRRECCPREWPASGPRGRGGACAGSQTDAAWYTHTELTFKHTYTHAIHTQEWCVPRRPITCLIKRLPGCKHIISYSTDTVLTI